MSLKIRKLSYALGAEVTGLDIQKPLDTRSIGDIHAAFLEHCLLLFRGQTLTREQHIAFSLQFGEIDSKDIRVKALKPGKPPGYVYSAEFWHSDQAHTCFPVSASLLRSVQLPDVGGDTQFANLYRAYDTLSDGMKSLIKDLHGVTFGGTRSLIDYSTPERELETRRRATVSQPLVRVHPETGRKCLFVSEKLILIEGMTTEESRPLVQFLCTHATRPQFCYRHQWRMDDLVMWDNRCLLHRAVGDFDKTQTRHLEKTQLKGTPSGYIYNGPLDLASLRNAGNLVTLSH